MYNSKLIQVLKLMSATDMTLLGKRLNAESKDNSKPLLLFNYLKPCHPTFDQAKVQRAKAGRAISKTQTYNDGELRLNMTLLCRMVEDYLVEKTVRANEPEYHFWLAQVYRDGAAWKQHDSQLGTYTEQIQASMGKYADRFKHLFHLNVFHALRSIDQSNTDRDKKLQSANDALDQYYMVEKLRINLEMLNIRNVHGQEYTFKLIDQLIESITANTVLPDEIHILYLAYRMLSNVEQGDLYCDELIALLPQKAKLFTETEYRTLYVYIENHVIRRINMGIIAFNEKLYHLYIDMLTNDVLIENNFLSQRHYKNIIAVGIKQRQFEWVKNFIETYKERLPLEERDNAYRYNMAYYCFAINDFGQTLQLLNEVEFSEPIYAYSSKILLLKSFYELDEEESMMALIHSFKQYLRRAKELSPFVKEICNNFTGFLLKIYKSKLQSASARKKLKAEIEAAKNVVDKAWLLSKV